MKVSVFPGMNFWWAIQSDNFPEVFPDGTLWAPLRGSSGQRVASWDTLHNVRPGDLVLHYSRPAIRGISRAATLPAPSYPPPRGYKEPAATEGTLVLTDPAYEVNILSKDFLEILPPGQGPLTAIGTLNRGYFYNLDSKGALQLLQQAGLEIIDDPDEGRHEAVPAYQYVGGPSDRRIFGAARTEQRFLRNQQLQLRGSSCSLCGQSFPEQLLVAAHIKPRSACSEKERMDTRNVSMLACLFGCDALFELGYVVVGESGVIEAGKPGPEPVRVRIGGLVGRKCRAHDERSRGYFEWHRQAHSGKLSEQSTPDLRFHLSASFGHGVGLDSSKLILLP
jgi:hypothetical protein